VDFTNRKAAIEGSHARWANKQQRKKQTKKKNKSHKKQKQIPQKTKTNPTNRNAFSSSFHSEK